MYNDDVYNLKLEKEIKKEVNIKFRIMRKIDKILSSKNNNKKNRISSVTSIT